MNKKGFTLVELLAVVVLLGIIMTLAVVMTSSSSDKAKEKLLKTKKNEIVTGAILFGQENGIDLFSDNPKIIVTEVCPKDYERYEKCKMITVGALLDIEKDEYIETKETITIDGAKKRNLTNDVTGKSMRNDEVLIYRKNNRVYATMYNVLSDK